MLQPGLLQEFTGADAQAVADAEQADDHQVLLPALNAAHVNEIKPGFVHQALQGIPRLQGRVSTGLLLRVCPVVGRVR